MNHLKLFENFILEAVKAERMKVINMLLDKSTKLSKLDKSLMRKLTGDCTIGQLTEKEQELYYFLLRGKKEDKVTRKKTLEYRMKIKKLNELNIDNDDFDWEEEDPHKPQKYLSNEPGVCPKCNSRNLNYGDSDIDGETLSYEYECEDCKFSGYESYDLVFTTHIDYNGVQVD